MSNMTRIDRVEAESMSQAHAEGWHTPPDGLAREGCPDCDGRELSSYPLPTCYAAKCENTSTHKQELWGRSYAYYCDDHRARR